MNGLPPRRFRWVITDRLAASERPGGYGITHRRVRREEEVMWLRDTGFTTILSLLAGNHNLAAYEEAGMSGAQVPMRPDQPNAIFEAIADAIADPTKRVLVHADDFGDELAGILAGFLVHTKGLNPPTAIAIIEKITERPIGPRGCAFVPGLPPPSAAMRT